MGGLRVVTLSLDFDINAGSDRENFEFVDRVEGGIEKIEDADVGSHLKLLAGLAVYVR